MSDTMSEIWKACLAHRQRLNWATRPQWLPHLDQHYLDGIEKIALEDPAGEIAAAHAELIGLLRDPDLALSETDLERARGLYGAARAATFPACEAFHRERDKLSSLTSNVSLDAVETEVLRDIDLMAHRDPTYRIFVRDMTRALAQAGNLVKTPAINGFYEVYAEAMVLRFLRGRGISTSRVQDTTSAPDFECQMEGLTWFVEVKSFDIVGGEIRHKQIMESGLEPQVEIEKQVAAGRRLATAVSEIAPFRKPHHDGKYDPFGLGRVIDTFREKCQNAFKPSQFERGPTFGLVVADRLLIPGGKSALSPYYYHEHDGEACVNGVLWHAAFARPGAPIFQLPEFAGKPNFKGLVNQPGYYADTARRAPGLGTVVLSPQSMKRCSFGLKASVEDRADWSSDDTEAALHAMCDYWNDEYNSRGFELSKYGP
jgi:hypothetical protein